MKPLKMYILIKDSIDLGHAINSAAHASLMGYRQWEDDPDVKDWMNDSFRKVTCKVTDKEFEKAKEYKDFVIVTEMAFDGAEVGLVFKPRREWPRFFNFIKLYK
jgi:hypothetical protein